MYKKIGASMTSPLLNIAWICFFLCYLPVIHDNWAGNKSALKLKNLYIKYLSHMNQNPRSLFSKHCQNSLLIFGTKLVFFLLSLCNSNSVKLLCRAGVLSLILRCVRAKPRMTHSKPTHNSFSSSLFVFISYNIVMKPFFLLGSCELFAMHDW